MEKKEAAPKPQAEGERGEGERAAGSKPKVASRGSYAKKSSVWSYFELLPSRKQVKCRACEKSLAYSGGTSGMHSHLRTHPTHSQSGGMATTPKQKMKNSLITDYNLDEASQREKEAKAFVMCNIAYQVRRLCKQVFVAIFGAQVQFVYDRLGFGRSVF